MDITDADIAGLGAKLTALELTDGERALLGRILDAAGDDEVAGFAVNDPFASYFGVASRLAGNPVPRPLIGDDNGLPRGFAESGKKAD